MSTKKWIILILAGGIVIVCGLLVLVIALFYPISRTTSAQGTPIQDFQEGGNPSTLTLSEPAPQVALATPVADQPAAGICASFDGEVVTFEILPDIPSPRCAIARPDQHLMVINRSGEKITVSLGNYKIDLEPGESGTIDAPFGSYLLPGVHRVTTTLSPELWLKDGG
jgi:hypothetical protein